MSHDQLRPFKLTALSVADGCREIAIEGELDLAVADHVQRALADCGDDRVLIDLSGCQFIDSSGLALILTADRLSASRIALHSPCDQVLRVLEMTGLTSNGLVFADREEALAAMAHR